jgi:hypothetical protein
MNQLWLCENTIQAGNTLANPTSITNFASLAPVIAANTDSASNAVRNFRLKAHGTVTFGAASTLTIAMLLSGTNIASTVTPSSGGALGPIAWTLNARAQIATTGATGSAIGHLDTKFHNTAVLTPSVVTNTAYTTVNTQNAGTLGLAVLFGTSNAGNTITLAYLEIEEIT